MSETQARKSAPRGRGSGRGGRGGYSSTRGGRPKQSESEPVPETSYEDQGEVGQLKKKHALNIITIKDMFPQFSEDDIVFALEENNGDMERTVERMTEGNVSQWGEVKKKTKEKAPVKTRDTVADSSDGFRGGRGRGDRGGRARAGERGRGRGRARDAIPGRKALEAVVADSTPSGGDSWDTPAESQPAQDSWADQPAEKESGWDVVSASEIESPAPVVEQPQPSSKPDGTRTWASMFAQKPKPKPVTPQVKPQVAEAPIATEIEAPTTREEPPIEEAAANLPPSLPAPEPAVEVTPSEDQLTESNLQQVPGSPSEPATATVLSNAGTNDVRTGSGISTPIPGSTSGQHPLRPGLGGFQTSALKATTPTPRTASFARRVKEQQEAVVMPGNHAVDRTAVQFGSLGLGSSSADLDADDDREQPETRTQPPQHSPVAPKASLPATSQPDTVKAAPGLSGPGSYSTAGQDQHTTQTASQSNYQYNQYGNYGYPGHDGASAQKGYEPFGQQAAQSAIGGSNGYPAHSQAPGQTSQQSQFGAVTSGGHDYSPYFTTGDHQRNVFNQYYSGFNQNQGGHEQKNASTYGTTSATELPATTATSQATHPSQTRFGGVDQNSGHSTPNPTGAQSQGQQGHGHGNQQHGGYPYGAPNSYYNQYYPNYMGPNSYGRDRPPFDDVRRYEEQYGQSGHYAYSGNHGGYGGGHYQGGKYGQPQGYGMPSQQNWDGHSGSPATTGSYGQQQQASGRDTSAYGRTGSAQPTDGAQQQSGNNYGQDAFSRSSAYGTQASHQGQQGAEDSSRGYGDSTKATGPSPVPGQNAGRPASAANTQAQGSQAQTYQNYPGQSQYGSGYGHQQNSAQGHQTGGYNSGYGGFGGNNYYGNNSNRGNWGYGGQ